LYSEKSHNIETNSVRNMLFNKFYRSETFWLKIIRQIIVYEEAHK
jgi:hypothetical protein